MKINSLPQRPKFSVKKIFWVTIVTIIIFASFVFTNSNPFLLFSINSLSSMGKFLKGFLSPEISFNFVLSTIKPILLTIQLATAGVIIAVIIGFPMAFFASSNFFLPGPLTEGDPKLKYWIKTIHYFPYIVSRAILNLMRSIPELIWALLFVRILGLGPEAGIMAIGIAYAGIIGKVFSEILENTESNGIQALRSFGASRPKIILFSILPSATKNLISYILYRWECAMRAAAILGFVGAGGIGQEIEISMRMFDYSKSATLIIELFLLVSLTDLISGYIRRKIS